MSALPETEPDGSERRVAPRMRTLKRAKIVFNNGYSTFDCIVRNISATGALLTIDEAAHLPKVFEILIGEQGERRPAKLVYRRGMFAGIRFRDIPEEIEEVAEAERLLRSSEAVTADLDHAASVSAARAAGAASVFPAAFVVSNPSVCRTA